MFSLHDHTRRLLCRAGFLLLCVLPTLGVAAWCANRNTAGHRTECEQALGSNLGVLAKIGAIDHTRPGVLLYHDVELAEPEASEPFFKARLIEAGINGGELILLASQPEIRGTEWTTVWELLGRRLRRQAAEPDLPVRFSAAELTVHNGDDSQTFTELRGLIEPSEKGTALTLSFRLAGVEMSESAKIRIERNRKTSPPTTNLELQTGGGALPCAILLSPVGRAECLGPRATFRGSVWLKEAASGWEGELSGQFANLALGRLIGGQFPHHLSGAAQVTVQKAVLKQGRVEAAEGSFSAGPGVIGRSLIISLYQQLHWEPGKLAEEAAELTPYEQLAFSFVLDPRGLVFSGQCRDGRPGAILETHKGPLLMEPQEQPQPVLNLVRALVPAAEVQIPATRESDWLLQHLPLPKLTASDDETSNPAAARLHLQRPEH
ncbi:MAG TPA: hypothetical protein VFE24_17680 [Pirellulales bacterium]|jgi:hypothetical protein|nr:hypothetical protein [Pirellulales bacterium]